MKRDPEKESMNSCERFTARHPLKLTSVSRWPAEDYVSVLGQGASPGWSSWSTQLTGLHISLLEKCVCAQSWLTQSEPLVSCYMCGFLILEKDVFTTQKIPGYFG
ncbi:uncharacterized protein ACBT57_025401 isoform 1-T1 [Dama dama]